MYHGRASRWQFCGASSGGGSDLGLESTSQDEVNSEVYIPHFGVVAIECKDHGHLSECTSTGGACIVLHERCLPATISINTLKWCHLYLGRAILGEYDNHEQKEATSIGRSCHRRQAN